MSLRRVWSASRSAGVAAYVSAITCAHNYRFMPPAHARELVTVNASRPPLASSRRLRL